MVIYEPAVSRGQGEAQGGMWFPGESCSRAVLARSPGAELSTVAWSGRGVVRDYGGEAGDLMGRLY